MSLQQVEQDHSSPAGRERLKGRHILIVDDEYSFANLLHMLLESWGARAVLAGNLDQALELARSNDWDAAVLDICLGDRTAAPVADVLAAKTVPFLFLTGFGDSAMLPDHLRSAPCLAKPVAPEHLQRKLRELIESTPAPESA